MVTISGSHSIYKSIQFIKPVPEYSNFPGGILPGIKLNFLCFPPPFFADNFLQLISQIQNSSKIATKAKNLFRLEYVKSIFTEQFNCLSTTKLFHFFFAEYQISRNCKERSLFSVSPLRPLPVNCLPRPLLRYLPSPAFEVPLLSVIYTCHISQSTTVSLTFSVCKKK